MTQLAQAISDLHTIARLIENKIGVGQLSDDVRGCADRLHLLQKPISASRVDNVTGM